MVNSAAVQVMLEGGSGYGTEKLAEADKREALANQKEKYIEELDKLRQEIKALTEENFTLKAKISAEKNTKNPIK